MLRSPTHAPTIQLIQIHQTQYDLERASEEASVYSSIYHEHNYPNEFECKQQQQQQQQQHSQQQQQQRQQSLYSKYRIKSSAPARSSLFTSTRLTKPTKITPTTTDVNSKPKTKIPTTTTAAAAAVTTAATAFKLKISNSNINRNRIPITSVTPPAVALNNIINNHNNQSGNNSNNNRHTNISNNSFKPETPASLTAATTTTTTEKPIITTTTKTRAATTTTTPSSSSSSSSPSTPSTTTISTSSMSPTSQTPTRTSSLFDSCHRKIRLIGGGPVAFLGGLVAKARRKERDGDQNSTDTKLYLEESVLERKLPEADLKALVDLPAGLDYNEWLASHTLALFEHVNLVYGTVSEFCTPSGCSDMTGPGNRTYLWFDEKGKKTRVAAPQYIDYVMTFTQKTVSDESIFPTKYANEFPGSFESIARKILRLQFHVIAHLYAAHFREIALLGLHTHLNLTFAHLTALHRRFNLIDEKETDVLRDLEVALRLTDDNNISNSNSNSNNNHVHQTVPHSSENHSNGSSSSTHDGAPMMLQATSAPATALTHAIASMTADGSTTSLGTDHTGGRSQPICTQPESKSGAGGGCGGGGGIGANNVFGGGGGLMGGILGDFTGSDFSDTSRYCTSAVPSSSSFVNNSSSPSPATNAAAANASSTNGAGALHLNFTNNYAHQHQHQHHHHHHHHHHPHLHHAHHQAHQPNLGLLQCNANGNAPSSHSTTTA